MDWNEITRHLMDIAPLAAIPLVWLIGTALNAARKNRQRAAWREWREASRDNAREGQVRYLGRMEK